MSSTMIDGGPAGPDGAGGDYSNEITTDRAAWWEAAGGRQGVRRGFAHSTVAGQMALDFTAGLGLVEERTALGDLGLGRGYLVWSETDPTVSFDPASAADRNDAVVLAFVDVAVGAAAFGTETDTVGGQLVVVPGVSGTTTARTDADIQAAVGSGGWLRLLDVAIPAGSTEIADGNITPNPLASARNPRLRVRRIAAQSIPSNTDTDVAMGTVDYDTHGGWDSASNEFYTIPLDGLYRIELHVPWTSGPATDTGERKARIDVNGTIVAFQSLNAERSAETAGCVNHVSVEDEYSAGDVIRFRCRHTYGGNLDTNTGAGSVRATVRFIEPPTDG